MRKFVMFLRKKSESYHMLIHVLLGVICGYFVKIWYPNSNTQKVYSLGILASVLPDLDHFLYYFWYGARSEYSKIVKKLLFSRQFRKYYEYVKINHKSNTGIYSHNIVTVILIFTLFWLWGIARDNASYTVAFLAWGMHYLYDIGEDFLFFKKLNSNWFMRFNRRK